jgi:hypothetical protein
MKHIQVKYEFSSENNTITNDMKTLRLQNKTILIMLVLDCNCCSVQSISDNW